MGHSISVSSKIEILAPPATVRSVFLDFARYEEWHPDWHISAAKSQKPPPDLKAGDVLRVAMHGSPFHPTVVENSDTCFSWDGSLYGLVVGRHQFYYSPSAENPGCTTFIQREDYTGPLTTLLYPWRNREWPTENWDAFNASLKREAERASLG